MQSRNAKRRLHLLAITMAAISCSAATLSGTLAAITYQPGTSGAATRQA